MRIGVVFRDRSIRVKLTFLIALNCCVALFLLSGLLLAYEQYQQRQTAAHELSVQAQVLSDSNTAALSFSDERAADETLTALNGDPTVAGAAIYGKDRRLFASYHRQGIAYVDIPAMARRDGASFENGNLLVFQPIRLQGERIGTAFLNKSLGDSRTRTRNYAVFVFLALIGSLSLALIISARMQRTITGPITELSDAARRLAVDKDYSVRPVRRTNDEIGSLIDSFNEMLTQIQLRERALRESEQRYAVAARGANDGLWDWKLTTNEIYFSARWSQMLGMEAESWSMPEDWFSHIHPGDRDRVEAEISAHREGKTNELVTEYRMRRGNGSFVWMLSRGICVRDYSGVAIRMAGSQTDITEGKVADPLTGLPNRLYFLDRLEAAIDATRAGAPPFAVLFLDLDRFKLVNDSLGHAAGDALLVEVGRRLQSSLRSDARKRVIAQGSVVARLGGDEFAILLNPVNDPAEASTFATAVRQQMSEGFDLNGHQMFSGVTIGIALSSSGAKAEDLLRNADTAMYRAKTAGKGRLEVFDDGMRKVAIERLALETELRGAIDEGQLVVHYQPTVAVAGARMSGFEALVRWNHPQKGLVPPLDFIPVAEETGLIVPLGIWVLTEACRQLAEWRARFGTSPLLTVAVNVSFRQLTGGGFVQDVARILKETGLPARCLKLEMTESTVMSNVESTLDTLNQLKQLGVGLEIDDFGTGYSSLSCLNRLPFDTLKIDRSFVRELGSSEESSEIVRTILGLARSMNMEVIAEGVETREQLEILHSLNCGFAQGYYYSKPISALAMAQRLADENLAHGFALLGSDVIIPVIDATKTEDLVASAV
ncbi:MAG: EAL domain-containing protein [Terriglobia bacterium]